MKKLLAVTIFLLGFSAFAGEGAGGHGGDPFLIYAVEYPDQEKLKSAITLAQDRIATAGLPDSMRTLLLEEIDFIETNKKFLYIENLIITGKESNDTFTLPQDSRSFQSLGAMTGNKKGDAIYFSQRTLKYSVDRFSEILIHELLHHTVKASLTGNEDFINDLSSQIMDGTLVAETVASLQKGIYVFEGKIDPAQFFDLVTETLIPKAIHLCLSAYDRYSSSTEKAKQTMYCSNLLSDARRDFVQSMGSDISRKTYQEVSDSITLGLWGMYRGNQIPLFQGWGWDDQLDTKLIDSGYTIYKHRTCKKQPHWFLGCNPKDVVLIRDIITN